jgi:selenocysteine-specific translation elongation factor
MNTSAKPFFEFQVDNVFQVEGQGAVVTGTVVKGAVRSGDTLYLKKPTGEKKEITILAIEGFRKILQEALMGESVAITIAKLNKSDFMKGDIITFDS